MSGPFSERISVEQVEESNELAPKFDVNGLIPVVTTDHETGELLMHGYMNEAAFLKSIETAEAHYYSRSRETIWHKGATSGLVQNIVEMRIDDNQDAVWLRVKVAGNGASCHVGYRSCFYRSDCRKFSELRDLLFLSFTSTSQNLKFDQKCPCLSSLKNKFQ